jgi:hypothetical protein
MCVTACTSHDATSVCKFQRRNGVFQRLKETAQRWVLLKIATVAAGARSFVETKHQCSLLRQENTALPSGLFPPGFAIRILYAFLIHLGLIILITEITKSSLYKPFVLGPDILLGAVLRRRFIVGV